MDIPIVYRVVEEGYPRMVARGRYRKHIPLVSQMLRTFDHLLVDPGQHGRRQLKALSGALLTTDRPIAIFPEGRRTRDGEIGPWRTAGVKALIGAGRCQVYVITVDGMAHIARLPDFVRHISGAVVRVEGEGPFIFDPETDDADEFLDQMRDLMCDRLDEMRGRAKSVAAR